MLTDLNIPRSTHSSCGFSDKDNQSFIYVFGGCNSHSEEINSIEKYDGADSSKWSLIKLSLDVFPTRMCQGAIQINELHILVFGGSCQEDSYLFDVE